MHRCAPLHEAKGPWLSQAGATSSCALASWRPGTLQLVGVAVLGVGLAFGCALPVNTLCVLRCDVLSCREARLPSSHQGQTNNHKNSKTKKHQIWWVR